MKHEERNHDRDRNRQKYGYRGSEAAQKYENHDSSEENSDAAFPQHSGNRFLHKHRLVENYARFKLRRDIAKVLDGCPNSRNDRYRVRISALLLNAYVHRFLPI